jgi:hypothetical protein
MDALNVLLTVLGYALALAPAVERIMEVVKGFFPKEIWDNLDKSWKYVLTLVIALIVSFFIKDYTKYWYLVGFMASLGSNFLHDFAGIVREYKKELENIQENIKKV